MAGPGATLLIRDAELPGRGRADVLVEGDRIARVGRNLVREAARVVEARGGLLLPGLHDHHIHLAALAVRSVSIQCGPPEVTGAAQLAEKLSGAPGHGWIRATGYHESVLGGLPDAMTLDRFMADRPLRMQHRSGRMWLLNSAAMDLLLSRASPPPGLERDGGGFTGRLFDDDRWLRAALGGAPPDFTALSAEMAAMGVTGVTDMSPHNGAEMAAHFSGQQASGALAQNLVLAGTPDLADAPPGPWKLGPVKLHLHEAGLPAFDDTVRLIRLAHEQGRSVAAHCVTEAELVYALAVIEECGALGGDRIEHASIAFDAQVLQIARNGLAVCVQPHFVAERGDRYLLDVEQHLHGDLYRLESLRDAGIALAGGSDAPFGAADPWSAMRAAVSRRTAGGSIIGEKEALLPETALALYLGDPYDFSRSRMILEGSPADICLLKRPWREIRKRLVAEDVAMTIVSGKIVHDGVGQAPVERSARG